ncbi:MAG: peroxide stress protein YaaA, partial [Planctomycetota bacterium]
MEFADFPQSDAEIRSAAVVICGQIANLMVSGDRSDQSGCSRVGAEFESATIGSMMIFVLSPAKSLDEGPQSRTKKHTTPELLDHSQELVDRLAKLSKAKVSSLMSISDKLAELNVARYKAYQTPFDTTNAKQALLMFKGDVYQGFDFDAWKTADFTYAQQHLRILSGLYGVLRPLDLIQPYRLEMGTKFKTDRGKDLYDFWGSVITDELNAAIKSSRSKAFVNLASNEYYKSVQSDDLSVPIVTPVFKD